jgi:hypothetical protein
MKTSILAIAAAALIASTPFALAKDAKSSAPGQMMQQHGSVAGSPGASGYAPGHLKKKKGSSAAKYAPGHTKRVVQTRTRATTSGAAVR